MKLKVAKSAGFCFGVQNAIKIAEHLISIGEHNIFSFGPIIHNKQVIKDLKEKGINVINDIDDIKENYNIIIRSHGISKKEQQAILNKGAKITDATCVNVKYIHKIVEEKIDENYKIIIIGDSDHPEVKGINGWCNDEAIIINDLAELENKCFDKIKRVCIVAQTTYNREKWHEIVSKLIKSFKESLVFNTICSATEERQLETIKLSKEVDTMIVVGGTESSNTKKLYEISKTNCSNTIFVETAIDLNKAYIKTSEKIGITAGASTPEYVIQDVIDKLLK